MQSDFELLERTTKQLSIILHAIEYQKQNNIDGNERDNKQPQQKNAFESSSSHFGNVSERVSNVPRPNDWHHFITHDLRSHLIEKQIAEMFPIHYRGSDEHICHVVEYTKKCESDIFKMANSKIEYYYLLSNKICQIQNELKVKREQPKINKIIQNQSSESSSTDTALLETRSINQIQIHKENSNDTDEQDHFRQNGQMQQQVKDRSQFF